MALNLDPHFLLCTFLVYLATCWWVNPGWSGRDDAGTKVCCILFGFTAFYFALVAFKAGLGLH